MEEILFRAQSTAKSLGYVGTNQAIGKNVCKDDMKTYPVYQAGQIRHLKYINELGIYYLILRSRLDSAKKKIKGLGFQGDYEMFHYIRKYYENAIIMPGLGKLQTTIKKWSEAY